jgi:hypothetical protein
MIDDGAGDRSAAGAVGLCYGPHMLTAVGWFESPATGQQRDWQLEL